MLDLIHECPRNSLELPGGCQQHSIWRVRLLTLLVMGISLGQMGCSREDIKQAIDDATTKTKSLTDTAVSAVEEALPETGSVSLEMNPPLQIDQAGIEVISIGDGRPNVVQISTYDTSQSSKAFPALLLHGTTDATSVSALTGSSIECDMYVQTSGRDPIAMTKPGGSVKLTFGSLNVDDNSLPATLAMAELVGSDGKTVLVRGGELVMLVRSEGSSR